MDLILLNTLQAGRAIAALMVVFHHAVVSIDAFVGGVPATAHSFLGAGYLGVDFFFVLSGFIIYYTTASRPIDHVAFRRFAKSRLTRIMVPYLPIGVGIACLYALLPGLSAGDREWGWVTSLTLFPTESPPALSVAWTLQHELIFYAFYAAIFFSGHLVVGLATWTVAIIASAVSGYELPLFFRYFLAPINLEFMFGVSAAWVFMNNRVPKTWIAAGISASCLLIWLGLGGLRSHSWIFGLAIAALIPAICRAEVEKSLQVPNVLVFLGAASYAIYLVHNPVLSVVSRVVAKVGVSHWGIGLLAAACVSTAAGVAYYWFYERPAMKAFRPQKPSQPAIA